MPPLLFEKKSLGLDTRRGNHIENYCDRTVPLEGWQKQCDDYIKKYRDARPRTTKPSSMYNCHGLTFGSRRTNIVSNAVLQQILLEDDYEEVNLRNIILGDVAVYTNQSGEWEHSGIVVGIEQFGARILSKWGGCHEVIHMVGDCPFDATRVKYYRVTK